MIEKYKALEADLETERLRLAACGVAALGYFDGCKDEYRSASLEDTLRLYEINKELKAENEESKNALGDYFCSADDLAPAIRRLVSAYQERNQTAAKFMQELNETEAERDELTRQLAEYKAENERLNTVPMKYRRMAFNAQLQKENEDLQFRNDRLVQDFADVTEANDALRRIHAENIEIFKRQLAEYKALLSNLMEVVEEPPERNCSCHTSPPCSDCVEWSGLREALLEARTAMKGTTE